MSDGVVLEADVYYPADPSTGAPAPGKFPVVLAQTPYGKRSATTTQSFGEYGGDGHFPYLVKRGYINAVVDVRGTGSSQGDFGLFSKRDARDGVELVRWAAGLERSSGKVGAAGLLLCRPQPDPHRGRDRQALAAEGDRAVGRGHRPLPRPRLRRRHPQRRLRRRLERAALDDAHRAARRPRKDPSARCSAARSGAGFRRPRRRPLHRDRAGRAARLRHPFWRERAPARKLKPIVSNRIPALMMTGWFDVYQRGVCSTTPRCRTRGRGRPLVRADAPQPARHARATRSSQGPWFHNPVGDGRVDPADPPRVVRPLAARAHTRLRARAGRCTRTSWAAGGGWTRAPIRCRAMRVLGDARTSAGHAVRRQRPRAGGADRIPWTPAASPCNRHPDQWSTGFGGYALGVGRPADEPCAQDDSTTQAGALTYTTEPFTRDTTLAGPISSASTWTSTSSDSRWSRRSRTSAPTAARIR